MRARVAAVLVSLVLTASLSGKEVFLSISGRAGNFFTDARIFNPSYTKDITVNAQYLPTNNIDNSAATVVPLVIPKRTMKVYDDAVQAIFGTSPPLGAIRLTSDDDFQASQRIYTDERATGRGTLGQFIPGLDLSRAIRKGVVLQLKAGTASLGSFRTNWGGVNPNTTVANISFKLFDRNNALAGTNNLTLQPYGVWQPQSILSFFGISSGDFSDAWISFESDQPVFLYGSVIDNTSVDPTFVPAVEDTGVAPPPPQVKTVTVNAFNFGYTVTPSAPLAAGDQVRFVIQATSGTHGFSLFTPDGTNLISENPVTSTPIERIITLPQSGNYPFVCIRATCGDGHTDMFGSLTVP